MTKPFQIHTFLKFLFYFFPIILSPQLSNAQTYCTPVYQWGCIGIAITNFSLGSINHSGTYCNSLAYNNFTSTHSTNLTVGVNYVWSVTTNYHSHNLAIWIDLNDDGDFDDPGELMYTTAAMNVASDNFTVPANAPAGTHRMRVRMKFHNPPFLASESCSQMNEGETRDYSVVILTGDSIDPVISGMPNDTVLFNNSGQCGAVVSWQEPTATDNVGVTSFVSTHANGSLFPVGVTTVTYTASDASGNTATASFQITVLDTTFPVITNVPADITQHNDPGECGAYVSWTEPIPTDNCPGVIFSSSHNPGIGFQTFSRIQEEELILANCGI